MSKIYKKVILYSEVKDRSLDEILFEVAYPIIMFNQENGWIDDTFEDILFAFNQEYKYDENDLNLIKDKILYLINNIN